MANRQIKISGECSGNSNVENTECFLADQLNFKAMLGLYKGDIIKGSHLEVCQFALRNPQQTIFVESLSGFSDEEIVRYHSNMYLSKGETITLPVKAKMLKIITGVIIFDVQNKENSADDLRASVSTDGIGKSKISVKITAPPDKGVNFLAIISESKFRKLYNLFE